jgi:hypothetical protein
MRGVVVTAHERRARKVSEHGKRIERLERVVNKKGVRYLLLDAVCTELVTAKKSSIESSGGGWESARS